MANLTGQSVYQPGNHTVRKKARNPAHMAAVAQMPCVICSEFFMASNSPVQVHHCIHGRYGTSRAPDEMTIPLCEGHHQGNFDTGKVALHREPTKWKELYGNDTDWISWVEEMLE